jgi:hypothetical protein
MSLSESIRVSQKKKKKKKLKAAVHFLEVTWIAGDHRNFSTPLAFASGSSCAAFNDKPSFLCQKNVAVYVQS